MLASWVSLGLECCASALLCCRGEASRRYVLFIAPLLVQEALRTWLWFEMNARGCSWGNLVLTIAQFATVLLVPIYWCWRAHHATNAAVAAANTLTTSGDASLFMSSEEGTLGQVEPWRRAFDVRAAKERQQLRTCRISACLFAVCAVIVAFLSRSSFYYSTYDTMYYHTKSEFCTSRGMRPWVQSWPWLHPPFPNFVSKMAKRGFQQLDVVSFKRAGRLVAWAGLTYDAIIISYLLPALCVLASLAFLILLLTPLQLYRGEFGSENMEVTVGWLPQIVVSIGGPFVAFTLALSLGCEAGSAFLWLVSLAMPLLALAEPAVLSLARKGSRVHARLPSVAGTVRHLSMGPRALVPLLRSSFARLEATRAEEGAFEPAAAWSGPRPGLAFKSGGQGLGYYEDNGKYEPCPVETEVALRPKFGDWLQSHFSANDVRGLGLFDVDEHIWLRMRYV